MPSEESPLRIKQLALMWVAMVATGILCIGLGFLFETFIWEPPAAALHLGGALLIMASASPAASILTELPNKWQLAALSSLGVLFTGLMVIAYFHFRPVFEDMLVVVIAAMTLLAMLFLLAAVSAYSDKLKGAVTRA